MNIYEYLKPKLTEIKGDRDKSTIIVGDFNTAFSEMYTSNGQEISKNIGDLRIPIPARPN